MSGEKNAEYSANEHRKIARIFQANYWSYLKGLFTQFYTGVLETVFISRITNSEVFSLKDILAPKLLGLFTQFSWGSSKPSPSQEKQIMKCSAGKVFRFRNSRDCSPSSTSGSSEPCLSQEKQIVKCSVGKIFRLRNSRDCSPILAGGPRNRLHLKNNK